jgi:hypothetical protein
MKTLQLVCVIFTGLTLCCLSTGQTITPQEQEGKFFFQVANIYFEVDSSFGARISSFKIDDEEILQQSSYVGDYCWGSTLWQSPQSEWNWPPSVELDQDPYSGGIVGNQVILRSEVDETYSHLVFKKVFGADLSDTSITIVYTMINEGTSDHSFSAWEVARVLSGGISFFPMGEGDVEGPFSGQTEVINDVVWYEQEDSDPTGQKFFCDGAEGWSAHVNDDLKVFVKKFDDAVATDNAPGEKEIELYYSGPTNYIELENQSAYTNIAIGDSVSWTMKWYLRNLPSGIEAQTGNIDLVNYVRNIVNPQQPDAIDNILTFEVNLYPNPACEYVTVKNLPSGFANLTISDVCGKVLYKAEIENNGQVHLTGLKSGLYFYQISGSQIRKSGRLLIRK